MLLDLGLQERQPLFPERFTSRLRTPFPTNPANRQTISRPFQASSGIVDSNNVRILFSELALKGKDSLSTLVIG